MLIQIKEMGLDEVMRITGHTTLIGSDPIRLAGESANGAMGHVGLSPMAPPLNPLAKKYKTGMGNGLITTSIRDISICM